MDMNVAVLCGSIAAVPELRSFESGARSLRYLVAIRSEEPRRRVDVLPATLWEPTDDLAAAPGVPGQRIWIVATVQRRFWDDDDGRRSRIELVARSVKLLPAVQDAAPG